MLKSRKWMNLAIVALFVAFGYGALRLYLLRFTAGDVYPPYSSFRADPVGTRAFYESLKSLGGLSVERHARPFSVDSVHSTVGNRASTWMFLGTDASDPDHAPIDFVAAVEQIMQHGGRVVMAFRPVGIDLREEYEKQEAREDRIRRMQERRRGKVDEENGEKVTDEDVEDGDTDAQADRPPAPDATDEDNKKDTAAVSSQESDSDDTSETSGKSDDEDNDDGRGYFEEMSEPTVEIPDRWGVRLEFDRAPIDSRDRIKPQEANLVASGDLPKTVTWHTATSFGELSDDWRVLYERDEKPVVIERPFGAGALVFASDSYFLSNEALRDERHPRLLSWMTGNTNLIVFEESHLGVARVPGVMTLIRGYGLYGVFWGLIGLAVLYVWMNAITFVPAYRDEAPSDARHATGRDSAAGFANLIRRSVAPRNLLRTCIEQYRKSLGMRQQDLAGPIQQMESIAAREDLKPHGERDPVGAYRAMCRVLKEYLRG